MRLVRPLIAASVIALALTPAFAPRPGAAQQVATPPSVCTGTLDVVYVSDVKPGMMQKFLQAVAAQQAWYKAAGTTDQISVMRIIDEDRATRVQTLSDTQVITSHTFAAGRKNPVHDEGYDAFTAMFKDSSTIKTSYFACLAT